MAEYESLTDEENLARAEKFIAVGEFEDAQRALDSVKKKSGKKNFLQSKIYGAKRWYSEQRKNLRKAVKAEPENEQYKKELEELEAFCKSDEYKKMKTAQMGSEMADCCILGGCECCASGACQAICDGCG